MDLGESIQFFRKQNNLSIKDLSLLVGISSSMLSQIERNLANPSIHTLKSIATALGVPIYRLFLTNPDNHKFVVKRGNRKMIQGYDGLKSPIELLTPTASNCAIEFCQMTIAPHSASNRTLIIHDGDEASYVLKGSLVLETHYGVFNLDEGDSAHIPPQTYHLWKNQTNNEAKLIYAISPPNF